MEYGISKTIFVFIINIPREIVHHFTRVSKLPWLKEVNYYYYLLLTLLLQEDFFPRDIQKGSCFLGTIPELGWRGKMGIPLSPYASYMYILSGGFEDWLSAFYFLSMQLSKLTTSHLLGFQLQFFPYVNYSVLLWHRTRRTLSCVAIELWIPFVLYFLSHLSPQLVPLSHP